MENRVIVIQGPSQYVNELKQAWNGYNLIWSTWLGDEEYYNPNDIVIFNETPSVFGTQNIVLQRNSTLNGILKAKELGYERVLKWRSDMIPTNSNKLVGIFNEKINMLFYHNVRGGYFIDYFMEGDINIIYNIWNFTDDNPLYAEKALTDNIKKLKLDNFNFIGNNITNSNDVYWIKNKIYLSTYKNNEDFLSLAK